MAFVGNGRIDGRMELAALLRKRRYPSGKIAIRHIEEFFENRIKTLYKNAPAGWKTAYTNAVFAALERYKNHQGLIESGGWQRRMTDKENKAKRAKR